MRLYVLESLFTLYLGLGNECPSVAVQKAERNGSTSAVLRRAKTAKDCSAKESQFTHFLVNGRPKH